MKKDAFLFLLIALLSLGACRREETTWQIDALGGIARGSLGIEDLIPDSLLALDGDGLWHLRIVKNLTDFDIDTLVEIPETEFNLRYVLPIIGGPFNIPPGTTVLTIDRENVFNVANASLKRVHLEGGQLIYTVRSYINGELESNLFVPGLTRNGTPTTINAFTSNASPTQTGVIDLAGYEVDLTGENGNLTNRLFSQLLVKVATNAANSAIVNSQDSIVVSMTFVDPVINYARGYFGEHTYTLQEYVQANSDLHLPSGSILLDDMQMNFRIENYVGADARIRLTDISGIHSSTGSSVPLTNGEIYQNFNISRATDLGGTVVPFVRQVQLNGQNSNLTTFTENLPDAFAVAGEVVINPLGNVNNNNDFLYTAKPLNVLLDIDLPLRFAASNLVLRDTIEWSGMDTEAAANGVVYLQVENGFPFGAEIELRLHDLSGTYVSSLLSSSPLAPAETSSSSFVTEATYSLMELPFTREQWGTLDGPCLMELVVTFSTPSYPNFVGIYEGYRMNYVLSARANVPVSFN